MAQATVCFARRVRRSNAPTFAQRWTFYIGPDGEILLIDKTGANQTQKAGETLLAHLKELGVKEKK